MRLEKTYKGKFILYSRRGKRIINYPRKEYKKRGIFFSSSQQLQTKGEERKFLIFSPKVLEKQREHQGIYRGIEGNTYAHL